MYSRAIDGMAHSSSFRRMRHAICNHRASDMIDSNAAISDRFRLAHPSELLLAAGERCGARRASLPEPSVRRFAGRRSVNGRVPGGDELAARGVSCGDERDALFLESFHWPRGKQLICGAWPTTIRQDSHGDYLRDAGALLAARAPAESGHRPGRSSATAQEFGG